MGTLALANLNIEPDAVSCSNAFPWFIIKSDDVAIMETNIDTAIAIDPEILP